MIAIEHELYAYEEIFISLHDAIHVTCSAVTLDFSEAVKWMALRISKMEREYTGFINIYFVNNYNEVCFKFEDAGKDLPFLYEKLDRVILNKKLPVHLNDYSTGNGDWYDDDFYKYGFKIEEISAIFPELKDLYYENSRGTHKVANHVDDEIKHDVINISDNSNIDDNSDVTTIISRLEEENKILKKRVKELEDERPILLKEYRDDDPLYLAIQIRNREWANYDPKNDRKTRGNRAAITQELKERGISEIEAAAIEKVACPINR
ncbi:hypothetical protein FQW43_10485 [Salmonella enterica subsp. enterica serovar Enteritidis]|nr:hypothetical protein [Salmonella enterica subsp. enterica serovar Enteritidis]